MSQTNDFKIDPDALDVEWLRQSELYHGYAIKLANARRVHDEAKVGLAQTDAQLELNIRERPRYYGVEKTTDKPVAAAVLDQPEHTKAANAVIVSKHVADLLSADCTALDHKRRALEGLVTLFGMDYFSKPYAETEEDQEAVDEIQKRSIRSRGRRRRTEQTSSDE